MNPVLKARLGGVSFALRESWRSLRATIMGRPERRQAALEYVWEHAIAGDPSSVLETLDDYARHQRFMMNVGDEKGALLSAELEKLPSAARVLELGAYCGYSAVLITSRLGTEGHLVSLEKDAESVRIASDMVRYAGLQDRVDICSGDSQVLIPELDAPFDLVFLDHWKGLYQRDLQLIEEHKLLRDGSVVFADNVGPMFNPQKYLNYVRTCGRYQSRYLACTLEYQNIEDGVEISRFLA